MKLFDSDHPAENIYELLSFLRAERQPRDLFRGQVRDYPALVPSSYRPGLSKSSAEGHLITLDEDRIVKTRDERSTIKWRVLNLLIAEVGIGIGNLLAQQYGLDSECIDVTDDPTIAAFFATRKWPKYEHYSERGLGVIYRWRALDEGFHRKETDLSLPR